MENNDDTPNDRKCVNKVRSCNNPPPVKFKNEPSKRKSCDANEAVRSLDLALVRLKKSKLVNGECKTTYPGTPGGSNIFMDMSNSSLHFSPGIDNGSMMSMNFSHYELMRNLSRPNCNSDGPYSSHTGSITSADIRLKDEHLERYFRSIDVWSRGYRDGNSDSVHRGMTE